MFRTICSSFPFIVCICWFVTFALHFRRIDSAKRVLTVFLGTCSVLYLCHAFFFNAGGELPVWAEAVWALCSLSVYPLYFVYITHLTCRPLTKGQTMLCLLPGILVALAIYVFPDSKADTARQALNALQIFAVLYFGYKHLQAFDREIADVYADTEGRDASAMRNLLIAFVATSLLSAVANAIGKENVAASEWLVVILVPFGILLYALSFIGYIRNFSIEQFLHDTDDSEQDSFISCEDQIDNKEEAKESNEEDDSLLGKKIAELMENDYYLSKDLKITDLAREAGSCRTYISNYVNKVYGCSFSDYVNQQRIEHAKRQLQANKDLKMTIVADQSGFSSEQSFYRNFKKFTGMTPAEWIKSQLNS